MEEVERSQDDQERFNQFAVKQQLATMPKGESAEECEDCGDNIPEDRREAYPGCKRCVTCQQLVERKRKGRR